VLYLRHIRLRSLNLAFRLILVKNYISAILQGSITCSCFITIMFPLYSFFTQNTNNL
jgi:hypothetical protein